MNDIQKQLDEIVDSYYSDLINTDISDVKDHKYSDKFNKKIEEAFAMFEESKKPKPHKLRRRIIISLIAAALIGTITVAAYEPARRFFINLFLDHTEVTPAENSSEIDKHKATIEKKYSITVPTGYVLDKESTAETDKMIIQTYTIGTDPQRVLIFKQLTKELYSVSVDNKDTELVTKLDKNGREILIHSYKDLSTSIIWDNGEYIFELSGEMPESELMDIYYTAK